MRESVMTPLSITQTNDETRALDILKQQRENKYKAVFFMPAPLVGEID